MMKIGHTPWATWTGLWLASLGLPSVLGVPIHGQPAWALGILNGFLACRAADAIERAIRVRKATKITAALSDQTGEDMGTNQ